MPDPVARAAELIAKIDARTAKVVVVGQGYVGLPVAVRAVEVGLPVIGYDIAPERVQALAAGRSFVQDVTDEQLAAALVAGYRPTCDTDDLRGFDVAVITVQTPLRESVPDLSFIERAARRARHLVDAGRARGVGIHHVSGNDQRIVASDPRGVGAAYRRRWVLLRLLARAHRSGQHGVDLREHREGRVRPRCRVVVGGRGVLRRARRQDRAGRVDG